MFTGIIEELGVVCDIIYTQDNMDIYVQAAFINELKIDQSIAHNGICMTVTAIQDKLYSVTAIRETISKTNLAQLKTGDHINLERCMKLGDRLDGHFVQGHVDTVAIVEKIIDANGSWEYTFNLPTPQVGLMVTKGSITVNGVSLTLIEPTAQSFKVAIIPYTYDHTNFSQLKVGDAVNIEFDILGKYIKANIDPTHHKEAKVIL